MTYWWCWDEQTTTYYVWDQNTGGWHFWDGQVLLHPSFRCIPPQPFLGQVAHGSPNQPYGSFASTPHATQHDQSNYQQTMYNPNTYMVPSVAQEPSLTQQNASGSAASSSQMSSSHNRSDSHRRNSSSQTSKRPDRGPDLPPEDPLDPLFERRDKDETFWIKGRIIRVLWSEPCGPGSTYAASSARIRTASRAGSYVYSNIRRFVIIRVSKRYCTGLAIFTHGGQGAAKDSINISEYGIIYGGRRDDPAPIPDEDEKGMSLSQIRVNMRKTSTLKAKSRLNYGKLYNIEFFNLVEHVGDVAKEDLEILIRQFNQVQRQDAEISSFAKSLSRIDEDSSAGASCL